MLKKVELIFILVLQVASFGKSSSRSNELLSLEGSQKYHGMKSEYEWNSNKFDGHLYEETAYNIYKVLQRLSSKGNPNEVNHVPELSERNRIDGKSGMSSLPPALYNTIVITKGELPEKEDGSMVTFPDKEVDDIENNENNDLAVKEDIKMTRLPSPYTITYQHQFKQLGKSDDEKRQIFNVDDRIRVTDHEVSELPYEAVVLLKPVSCTGTLIGPRHVLTAAHCLYKKGEYLQKIKAIKVGLLNRRRIIQWMKVEGVTIPKMWRAGGKDFGAYDFAIVKLACKHGRRYLPVDTAIKKKSVLKIAGFPADKSMFSRNEMWFSECTTSRLYRNYILSKCDAGKGTSGAAVLVRNSYGLYSIAGVLSRTQNTTVNGRSFAANIAIRLDHSKKNLIEKIIKEKGGSQNC